MGVAKPNIAYTRSGVQPAHSQIINTLRADARAVRPYVLLFCNTHTEFFYHNAALGKVVRTGALSVVPEFMEEGLEFAAGDEDAAFDGAEGQLEMLCDFLVLVALDEHHEGYAVVLADAAHGR